MPKLNDPKPPVKLRVPMLRVLRALASDDPDNPPALSRAKLCERAGFSPISGTITSALNGVPPNSSHGAPYDGLVTLGYVRRAVLDVDGVEELTFSITPAGQAALLRQLEELGDGPTRDAASSTNKRYAKEGGEG